MKGADLMTYRGRTGVSAALFLSLLASCGGSGSGGAADAEEGPEPILVDFEAVGGSAAEGRFTLTLQGDMYAASVTIDTYRGPGDYPIEIHTGSCAEMGGPLVVVVTSVEGQEGGEGQSQGTFAASELAPGGSYYVDIHDAQSDEPIGCGDLPAL